MTCPAYDQDLLLFVHNALAPLRRLRVMWHLRTCAECRERMGQLTSVSQQIAGALRPAGLASWKPASQAGGLWTVPLGPLWMTLITALVILVLATSVIVANHMRSRIAPHPSGVRSLSGPCRPDLPNSRCQ